MSLKGWARQRIGWIGIDLRTEKDQLLSAIKALPDDIDIYVKDITGKVYKGIQYNPVYERNNIHILINPSNEVKENERMEMESKDS